MDQIKNIWEFKKRAEGNLSKDAYEYLTGGADDMRTLNKNIGSFQKYGLVPRRLVDVSKVDTSIDLFGQSYSSPIMVAPVGMQKLFHPDGELATARACRNANQLMIASTVANYSYAEIARETDSKAWFQLYCTTRRSVTEELILKAEESGCKVLVLTTDVPVVGNREKHAKMLVDNVDGRALSIPNLAGKLGEHDHFHDSSITWDLIPWIRKRSQMKLILKGILHPLDVQKCLEYDVDGIIVSNHGGRQLESNLASIDALPAVIAAADDKIPVFLDGGIRRGTDVLKALAMGAKAVCLGRAFVYGLAANGETGVRAVLKMFQDELVRNMQLCGITSLSEISNDYLIKY